MGMKRGTLLRHGFSVGAAVVTTVCVASIWYAVAWGIGDWTVYLSYGSVSIYYQKNAGIGYWFESGWNGESARLCIWFEYANLGTSGWTLYVPLWPVIVAIVALMWWTRERKCVTTCWHCSYDLTGNVSGICPECGTEVPAPEGTTSSESPRIG
jgi:hypothetical protein